MKDKLTYVMSFVGKRIVFDVGWFDYYIGTIKSVEVAGNQYDYKVKFVVDNILNYNSTHHNGHRPEFRTTDTVLLENYLNYHRQRWGMWALVDSKAGKDLVARIKRTWDRKTKDKYPDLYDPSYDPASLTEANKKYYDMLVERKAAGLPIYVRTKYRGDSTDYRLEKVEAKDYQVDVYRGKAFVTSVTVAYAHRVKATNFNKKYFFEEV
jgi:hypothetical protein